ncbi:MAG: dTDP-4-dehydrorhamnose 3,5-epimerase [Ardenticatenaceae bacterium]|nr:dTDP-4-dehydrorhamnose 3,5-epimerase [Anaerolineales bacterium]MCB8941283.1 dTDP-4-dehydrorhamnose 3,5-epimerase [Ardenticatenaceae bacterium]MCB8972638.1 dTDP-4-dehydrorhamnose 3,5-epimerase [Ardenticatenaceae bacterium]
MPFQFHPLTIPEVILVEPQRFGDARGFFMETYQHEIFAANGIALQFVQDNHSRSAQGVLRGLHYQIDPYAQGKLLKVVVGEIFDVAVDIRRGSPTFGQWAGEILSAENGRLLYVPPGFAHGFCVLSETADLIYKTTNYYHPESDRGIIWNDPQIGIQWPIHEPLLSAKDEKLPLLAEADFNFSF